MPEARSVPRKMSAGVILVDAQGRVLMQLRDSDPAIMFPDHWGITGGAAKTGETPEDTARREVREETGLDLGEMEPFRAYYNTERTPGGRARAEYELYLYHALCVTPADELVCGEGRELRFFAEEDLEQVPVAYNHREVLADFFASPAYARYERGGAQTVDDPVAHFVCALDDGAPWFEALMEAIAIWQKPQERVDGRQYRYLIGGEAFDWLLLAERLLVAAGERVPADAREQLLFHAVTPDADSARMDDARLRALFGETKHRAHLNFVYGVTVEEALQYVAELEISKERATVQIPDYRDDGTPLDPVYERIYGRPRAELLAEFRAERGLPASKVVTLADHREFLYWLFKYRVKNSEPARVASDTRKALAQLSSMEDAARRARERRAATPREPEPVAVVDAEDWSA